MTTPNLCSIQLPLDNAPVSTVHCRLVPRQHSENVLLCDILSLVVDDSTRTHVLLLRSVEDFALVLVVLFEGCVVPRDQNDLFCRDSTVAK